MKKILVATADASARDAIDTSLQKISHVTFVADTNACLKALQEGRYDYLFIDVDILSDSFNDKDFKNALIPFWNLYPSLQIIALSSDKSIRRAVSAVKAGANDYLTYPLDSEEIKLVFENLQELLIVQSEIDYLRDQFWQTETIDLIKTRSHLMNKVYEKVRSVALTRSTVLITGETGTGKGVLANIIHLHSNRQNDRFISVHCGAIPDTLLESELFGHEKGAFTGAVRRKLGKFEIAHQGTIFLDEIGTLTPSAQIKLLQVLQDGTFQRVGGEQTIQADVRVIAATNSDLNQLCEAGQFRKDLFYRLNVFPVEMPPLRDRSEDIALLVDTFLDQLNKVNAKNILEVHPLVMNALQQYNWPGNIRELENIIERAYILETSNTLTPESLPVEFFKVEATFASLPVDASQTLEGVRRKAVEDAERIYLKETLSRNSGKINDTAKAAGIGTRQLHKLMKKHGIKKEDFKSG